MPYSDIVKRDRMSKMKWEIKKGTISEERLHYVVVTKQPPNSHGLSEQRFISWSCKACWDPWEPLSSVWSLGNEKCFHHVDPQCQRVTSTSLWQRKRELEGRALVLKCFSTEVIHATSAPISRLTLSCCPLSAGSRARVGNHSAIWWVVIVFHGG